MTNKGAQQTEGTVLPVLGFGPIHTLCHCIYDPGDTTTMPYSKAQYSMSLYIRVDKLYIQYHVGPNI